jgi:hypothetical protein
MRSRWIIWAGTILLACGATLRANEPFRLRVLYAGNPGSDRENDFKSFLEKHFVKVGTTDYGKFTEDDAKSYDVVIQFDEMPVPDHYRRHVGGDKLGKTMRVWKVQTKKYPEIDPGLVSDPYGFNDSPDTEFISSGLNSKGPNSVALARQANYFLWGFSASPSDMTPEACKCFANVVCYIHKFDGQKPLVYHLQYSRLWALECTHYLGPPSELSLEYVFPKALRDQFGNALAKYLKYYEENLEYLYPAQPSHTFHFLADEDVKALRLSNRKMELLDRCIAMIEQGDRADLALRVLKRYTTESFTGAQDWRAWLDANRARLFFTDVGGFKWMVAPESLVKPLQPRTVVRRSDSEVPHQPDAKHPVVAAAELSPAKVHPGETFTLIIRVKTAPSWHIYAVEGSSGPSVPTTLKLKLPEHVVADGDWTYPEATRASDRQMIYEGEIAFRRALRVDASAASGPIEVACELGYQACDPFSCRLPTGLELKTQAEVTTIASRPQGN